MNKTTWFVKTNGLVVFTTKSQTKAYTFAKKLTDEGVEAKVTNSFDAENKKEEPSQSDWPNY